MKGGTFKENKGFNEDEADKVGQRLRKAMKGIGTDEKVIIQLLTKYNAEERKTITDRYKAQYGRDLLDDFKSELSGHLLSTVCALMEWENHYLAQCCFKAMAGAGTNEKVLVEILCGCKQDMVGMITDSYEYLYDKSMEAAVESELSGDIKQLVVALLQGGRDDEGAGPSKEKAKEIAQQLYEAGEGMNGGTDEEEFIRIFATTSYPQLKQAIEEYTTFADNTLENAIESEFSGDIKEGLLTVVRSVRDQVAYFAKALHDAMDGIGTDDEALIRILVTRSEIDLEDIKDAYKKMYKTSLADAVRDDTKGDYRKLLLAIIK